MAYDPDENWENLPGWKYYPQAELYPPEYPEPDAQHDCNEWCEKIGIPREKIAMGFEGAHEHVFFPNNARCKICYGHFCCSCAEFNEDECCYCDGESEPIE